MEFGVIAYIHCYFRREGFNLKKIAVLMGVLLLLTGCSAPIDVLNTLNNDMMKGNRTATESGKSSVTLPTEASENITDESNVQMEYIRNNTLTNLTDFSEGKAFVQFEDHSEINVTEIREGIKATQGSDRDRINYITQHWDVINDFQGYNRAALIDTQGRIIWKSEFTKENNVLKETSVFRNGLAYFIFCGNEKSTYNIIDSDGNITFTRDFTEDFKILGHGDGLFLVAEHVVNFDTDEWQIGAMDKNGIMVVAYKVYETDTAPTPPMAVDLPADHSMEMQDIEISLSQLEAEYQAWLEECWDYTGETGTEYYKKMNEIEEDFNNRRAGLEERRRQLMAEYTEQSEKYDQYQEELSNYEITMNNYVPKTMRFDMDFNNPDYYRSCEYLGDNIYKLNFGYGFEMLNIDTQNIINQCNYSADEEHIECFITGFENGSATVLYNKCTDTDSETVKDPAGRLLPTSLCSIYRMDVNGLMTLEVTNAWTKYVVENILAHDNIFSEGLLFVPYEQNQDKAVYTDLEYYAITGDREAADENGFILQTGAYYDIEGRIVIDFPEYRGKKDYICSPFYNGYAVVLVKGEDQLVYFTVIDKTGAQMFDPRPGFIDVCISKDGKYVVAVKEGMLTVFDVKGNPLTSIDYHKIMPIERVGHAVSGGYNYDETSYDVIDGMIRFNDFYVNIEEGMVLGSTFMAGNDFTVTRH